MTELHRAPPAAPPPRYRLWLVAGLLALLALRVLSLWLNQTDLFFDEAQYWSWAKEPAFGYFSKPPMLAWLLAGVTSVCGDTEFCVRLAGPIFHTGAALFVFWAAKSLYDMRVGVWSALVYATLPGVTLSASLSSTAIPLLFFWTAALLAWVKLMETRSLGWALWLGLALGLGLLSKYAMAYFYLSVVLVLITDRESRWLLGRPHGLVLILLPALLLAPNMFWNLDNGLVTLTHTAANAKWGGSLFHPLKALEFFGSQFGVFGPVLMGVLIWIVIRVFRQDITGPDRMLVLFSIPVIALITVQAFMSRAHANWAAVAYPAAAILVTATMLRLQWRQLFRASLLLHLAVVAAIAVGNAVAPSIVLPGGSSPYARLLGWEALAEKVRERWKQGSYSAILTEDRLITAELLYYLRGSNIRIVAWKPGPQPRDHYELTRPYGPAVRGPLLLVTIRPTAAYVTNRFAVVEDFGVVPVAAGPGGVRRLRLFALDKFKGQEP